MPDNLMQIAFYVLCATALGGLLLSAFVLGGREAPKAIAIGHGAAGAAGIVMLGATLVGSGMGLAALALVVLVGAASGGLYLAHRHPRDQSPEFVVLMHALAAVTGVIVVGIALSRAG
jgi:hypothetical protein